MSSFSEKFRESNTVAAIPQTVYTAPREKFSNSYSSVNAGLSTEGGLKDLTFKSIGYTKYAENLELMKDALYHDGKIKPSIIDDKPFEGSQKIEDLKKEIENLKHEGSNYDNLKLDSDKISHHNNKLNELLSAKQSLTELGNDILEQYKDETNSKILINSGGYTQTSTNVNQPINQISDVPQLDETAYLKPQPGNTSEVFGGSSDGTSFITGTDVSGFTTATGTGTDDMILN